MPHSPGPCNAFEVHFYPAAAHAARRTGRQRRGSRHDAHLHHLGALLLAAGKADVDRALEHLGVHLEQLRLLTRELDEVAARQLGLAA